MVLALIGVIPAAGFATRLQPLEGSKEVYPVHGRPVMDYLIARMKAAGASEIRVVTRPDKADVRANAEAQGATVVAGTPTTVAESLLLGLGGAADGDVVLLGFPDSVWEPLDGFARVLELLAGGCDVGLGLFRPRSEDLPRYETVELDPCGRVQRIDFRPPSPSSSWIWGCAATTAGVLHGLREESQPGILFDALARAGRVGGVRLSEVYVDMGTPDGLAHAQEAFAPDR